MTTVALAGNGGWVPAADDLVIGRALPAAPEITVDAGVAALYQSITGDRMRLTLSDPLSQAVTGEDRRLINPGLVMHLAIGQSTVATRKVIANLFYRGVRFHRPVHVGDTLRTTVTPAAARRASSGPRAKILLRIRTELVDGSTVIEFERVALLPVRDEQSFVESGNLGTADADSPLEQFAGLVPGTWDLGSFPYRPAGADHSPVIDALREPVTDALAMVRLTGNLAAPHRDPVAGQRGQRLVYGGHVVALAQAALFRQVDAVTVLGWRSCDHRGPVFEDDLLKVSVELRDVTSVADGELRGYRVSATAAASDGSEREVLRWQPVLLTRPAAD